MTLYNESMPVIEEFGLVFTGHNCITRESSRRRACLELQRVEPVDWRGSSLIDTLVLILHREDGSRVHEGDIENENASKILYTGRLMTQC